VFAVNNLNAVNAATVFMQHSHGENILASSDRRGMLIVAGSLVLPSVRVLRVGWLNLIFT
jgi:hypothetical protein